jgi:hypothetical protein
MKCAKCGKEMNLEEPLKQAIDALHSVSKTKPEIKIVFQGNTCDEFSVEFWLNDQSCDPEGEKE